MNLYPTLTKLYPENSYGGQCFDFMHKLVLFPHIGTLLSTKKQGLQMYGIPVDRLDTIKVGDVLLTNESLVFGHGCMVNAIIGDKLQLTESNYHLDLKVHHTRQIWAHSPVILGVFRGNYLFDLPEPQFPIQLTVTLLMNHPIWPSLLQHMANLQNWFWVASGQRIQLIIDYKTTNLAGWDIVYTGPVLGGNNVAIIKEDWFNQNLLPLSDGANFTIFNMPRSAWAGTVFDNPGLMELGYCYEKINMGFPVKIMTVCDEHDDYPPYYPNLGAYAKVAAHEIVHGLYGLAVETEKLCNGRTYKLPPGSDACHDWFYGQNGHPLAPEKVFEDFNYAKLASKI
jgi:hypothetical protein